MNKPQTLYEPHHWDLLAAYYNVQKRQLEYQQLVLNPTKPHNGFTNSKCLWQEFLMMQFQVQISENTEYNEKV